MTSLTSQERPPETRQTQAHSTHARPSSGGTGACAEASSAPQSRLVTDIATRVLHAILGLSFGLAFVTAESEWWRLWHLAMGYVFVGAAVMRVLFGLLGPKQAHVQQWWRRSQVTGRWLMKTWQPKDWTLAHFSFAPLMAIYASIIMLLLAVLPVTLTGLVVQEDWGPGFWIDWMAELHEFVGELMLALVFVHIAAVLLHGWLKRTPHWKRMFGGRLPERGPDVQSRGAIVWAVFSVVSALTFLVLVMTGFWAL